MKIQILQYVVCPLRFSDLCHHFNILNKLWQFHCSHSTSVYIHIYIILKWFDNRIVMDEQDFWVSDELGLDSLYCNRLWACFTKQKNVITPYLVKSGSHEILLESHLIILEFDWCLSSSAAKAPVKFQSNQTSLTPNFTALSLCEIQWYDIHPFSEWLWCA